MHRKILFLLLIILSIAVSSHASTVDSLQIDSVNQVLSDTNTVSKNLPVITYATPRTYKIAGIKIAGIKNPMYEDYTLLGFAQLQVGDKIGVPGIEITNAIKRFWKQGLFSNVKIKATKIQDDKIWLEIDLTERPRISDIQYFGVKKSEMQDLEAKIGVVKNLQITPNQLDRAKGLIKKYFDEKGFNKAKIDLRQLPDPKQKDHIILAIHILKNNKTKVNTIVFEGNKQVKAWTLLRAMKKTREKSTFKSWIMNFLRSTKYVPEDYQADKEKVIDKYNQLGYRDAQILSDTVFTDSIKKDKVNIRIKLDEGKKYFIKDIKWVGNTKYPTWELQALLNMKRGDVYDQKKLMDRLSRDDDAVMNALYQNNGYIFSNADPVEVNLAKDSVSLEIRVYEGRRARIRKVSISGNDRVYEDVVRRELRIKPGALYSRDDIMRSLREIAQNGQFDPENLQPKIDPDPENGTVDIGLPLVSKANDQVEFSAGWGETGIIGKLSLKFSNFSIRNLFNPKTYKGIIPQGDGQSLTISAQTNARYYQSYSISFEDPWFGGKRPNSFSVSAYYSRQTDIASRYYNNMGYGYGMNYWDGGNNGMGGADDYSFAADPNKYMSMMGLSVGYGKRLNWPDDYFYFQGELSYQIYNLKNWAYFPVKTGLCNDLSVNFTLSRRSIDNPTYTRRGTDISASLQITPPYSLWDGVNYAAIPREPDGYESGKKFRWVEYHKWKFKCKTFIPLSNAKKTPVIMTRSDFGFIGYFNRNKQSPFGQFYVGGDGMSGYSGDYTNETIGLRGYENGSLGYQNNIYERLAVELRYPLILEPSSTIYLLTFAEAGNAWVNLKKFNPFELKRSAGVGVRIQLPMIGLMGIDWGYGFDPLPDGRGGMTREHSKSQFHFIIGQEF